MVFRQEYMAEFLEDSAGAFRGVEYCLLDFLPTPTGPKRSMDWDDAISSGQVENSGGCL